MLGCHVVGSSDAKFIILTGFVHLPDEIDFRAI